MLHAYLFLRKFFPPTRSLILGENSCLHTKTCRKNCFLFSTFTIIRTYMFIKFQDCFPPTIYMIIRAIRLFGTWEYLSNYYFPDFLPNFQHEVWTGLKNSTKLMQSIASDNLKTLCHAAAEVHEEIFLWLSKEVEFLWS